DKTNNTILDMTPIVVSGTTDVVVDNSDPAYSETGTGWATYSGGSYGGSLRYASSGTGADTATWAFAGPPAGQYDAQVDWLADPNNRASNATYTIYDGSTLVGTAVVNQQQAPAGTSLGGVTFQSLGLFRISSGTLRIVLSDAANGLVVADAVH